MQRDIMASLFIASLLLNVFFLSGVLLFNGTNKLDESVYSTAYSNLCENNYSDNLTDAIDNSKQPITAAMQHEIRCNKGGFEAYYQNAVEAYARDNGAL